MLVLKRLINNVLRKNFLIYIKHYSQDIRSVCCESTENTQLKNNLQSKGTNVKQEPVLDDNYVSFQVV